MVTLKLPQDLYARLEALATAERTDVLEFLRRMTEPEPESEEPSAFQRILERATDLGVSDLAEQHDHYLYGLPKR
jgi:hypothetical protein